MQRPNTNPPGSHQFLAFTVPGLPNIRLAIWLQQMIEIAPMLKVRALPFTLPHVVGISLWRGEIVTVVDLGQALCGSAPPASILGRGAARCAIARVPAADHMELVAWEISSGGAIVTAPPQVPASSPVAGVNPRLLAGCFVHGADPIHLITLSELFT